MADETYRVRSMKLGEADANRLGRWSLLWADLMQTDMVLLARTE